jgi:hypothetical protein
LDRKPRTNSLSVRAAAAPARPAAQSKNGSSRVTRRRTSPPEPKAQTYRGDVLAEVRLLFSDGQPRDRETALRDLADALGYERLGPRIRETLETDLLTAARRGIIENVRGDLSLFHRSIEQYERAFLKDQFLASLGRAWTDRDDASRAFARWLGFTRTGPTIHKTARSIINGLLRENRIEADGRRIRKL